MNSLASYLRFSIAEAYQMIFKNLVKGVMVESYIEPGNQTIHDHVYGKSITDPCLGWAESEKLIYDIAEKL